MYNNIINKIKLLEDQNMLTRVGEGLDFLVDQDLIKITPAQGTCVDCGCTSDQAQLYIMDDGGPEMVCLCTECLLNLLEPENFSEHMGL